MWLTDPINQLVRSQGPRCRNPEKICGEPSCLCLVWEPPWIAQEADNGFKHFVPAEILSAWIQRNGGKMKSRKNDSEGRTTDGDASAKDQFSSRGWSCLSHSRRQGLAVGSPQQVQRTEQQATENCSQVLNLMEFVQLSWKATLEFWTSDPFVPSNFSLYKGECLFYICLTVVSWKQNTCFLGVTGPQMERNFALAGPYPKPHPQLI